MGFLFGFLAKGVGIAGAPLKVNSKLGIMITYLFTVLQIFSVFSGYRARYLDVICSLSILPFALNMTRMSFRISFLNFLVAVTSGLLHFFFAILNKYGKNREKAS